jgi:glycosyltransferase involved in cell wall biosynthesis
MTIMITAHKADFSPSLDELIKINEISPLVQILSDGGDPPWHSETIRWRCAFTTIVSIDGNPNWPSRDCDLTLLTPVDFRFYDNMPGESDPQRDIHAGFWGAIGSGPRGHTMGYLYDRGLITHRGYSSTQSYKGYTGEAASYKEYADFMRRCKIIVNHSMTANELNHVKGRVLEAGWAGACLLENKNPITPLWFKPGIHYIEYNDADHAAQLIEQLKSEPGHIEQIARALHEEIVRNHSPRVFWSKVLYKVGWHPEGW